MARNLEMGVGAPRDSNQPQVFSAPDGVQSEDREDNL
eukprot:CAMPEP_0179183550 /NCGR_PEP_ID=MMETSP0796-20121207/90968_1 /TAXON_ID=73915 /ORGANISM="Pyrodinium bahamense, Strain pbaha01" /LENGTH=36 /DNA_ID= /DNA_START= /DNA_END= /DNA_ORIENTATION=